jgi:hypothetical protein
MLRTILICLNVMRSLLTHLLIAGTAILWALAAGLPA